MQHEKNKWLVQLQQKNNSLDEFFVEYRHGILCPNMTDHFPFLEETTDMSGTEPGTEELIFLEDSKGPITDRESSWEEM